MHIVLVILLQTRCRTSESLLTVLRVSPGKAFIKGYEIEKIAKTNIDLNKARDFNTVNAGIATFELVTLQGY